MSVDPSRVCLFIPPELKRFKLNLFERIGREIEKLGGRVVRDDHSKLDSLPRDILPIVGCSPQLRGLISLWREQKRNFVYWDRGYARRVFATWLPRGDHGGHYRWHVNSFQLQSVQQGLSDDRWHALKVGVTPWRRGGRHVLVAAPTPTYAKFHGIRDWTDETLNALALVTDRQIVVRCKESKRPLQADLENAHAIVSHGSNAAVEAVICGCPAFVDTSSAAALVGSTDLREIEKPQYPGRRVWLNSLAYSQFNERELVDGTLWRLLR